MSRSTGPELALLVAALALALGACSDDPDALITVSRTSASKVDVEVCEMGASVCPESYPVFAVGEPTTVEHTIGIYLDVSADVLDIRFTISPQAAPKVCAQIALPFDDAMRELGVVLDGAQATISGCPDCTAEVCSP